MKVAQWLIKEYSLFSVKEIYKQCSKCGYGNIHVTQSWRFCPHCGAKMQSKEGANNG